MSADRPLVAVLDYGIGNLRSAQKSLEKVGADARLTSDPGLVAEAAAVVLPGVGHFGSCMRAVRDHGLVDVARAAVDRGQPFLGICVGAQMMFTGSDEAPDEPGLGLLDGRVERLADGVKHPQMQWNRLDLVRPDDPLVSGLPDEPWMYFVHSFAPVTDEVVATCEYGGTVVAIAGRPGLWACQFHPEKSSHDGLALLRDFVEVAARVRA
ncbi:MAG: imidazole glycerol phosphate synthase subunit HisH [Actinomycetota bacterium]